MAYIRNVNSESGKQAMAFYNGLYKQLVGCEIIDFRMEQDEYEEEEYWPVFTLRVNNVKHKLVLSRDEEGNGGGFAFLEPIKGE